jgi:hypothetical protein
MVYAAVVTETFTVNNSNKLSRPKPRKGENIIFTDIGPKIVINLHQNMEIGLCDPRYEHIESFNYSSGDTKSNNISDDSSELHMSPSNSDDGFQDTNNDDTQIFEQLEQIEKTTPTKPLLIKPFKVVDNYLDEANIHKFRIGVPEKYTTSWESDIESHYSIYLDTANYYIDNNSKKNFNPAKISPNEYKSYGIEPLGDKHGVYIYEKSLKVVLLKDTPVFIAYRSGEFHSLTLKAKSTVLIS